MIGGSRRCSLEARSWRPRSSARRRRGATGRYSVRDARCPPQHQGVESDRVDPLHRLGRDSSLSAAPSDAASPSMLSGENEGMKLGGIKLVASTDTGPMAMRRRVLRGVHAEGGTVSMKTVSADIGGDGCERMVLFGFRQTFA